jgi:hypothetical protein
MDEKVLFFVNICIPDTDICYPIDMFVSDDGQISIKEMAEEDVEN